MQLDSHLVERFHALHRQRLSGLLQASGADFSLGICLVEGDPVAIDLGQGLEQAFAQACRTYHKLDEAGLAELSAAMAGGAKARDYLVGRQLISEAEGEQLAQAVVEDSLTHAFRGPCTGIEFTPGTSPDAMAIGVSAVKMRIGVEALIRTCDARVGEQLAVEREIGGWDAVFALSENENVSGQLSEYEKMVLNFIDGRATVEQIAELCRDSSMNLGRVLRALIAKHVIRRSEQPRGSGQHQALAAPRSGNGGGSGVQPAPLPAGSVTRSQIEVYHAPRESGSRTIVMVGLLALLGLSVIVGVLVVQYNSKQQRMRRDENEINQHLQARQWADARATVERLRKEAGNDLAAMRTVDGLAAVVKNAIEGEQKRIAELIAKEEFPVARQRLASLPEETALATRLREAESEVRAAAQALADEVRVRLAAGDVAGALAEVDDNPGVRGAGALRALEQWRTETLTTARNAAIPLQSRLTAVARLRQSRPDATIEAQLAALDGELLSQVNELAERLGRLEVAAAAGAWRETQAELARLRLRDIGSGSDIEQRAGRAAAAAKRAADELEAAVAGALRPLAAGAAAEPLLLAREQLAGVLRTYPQASDRAAIERVGEALAACAGGGPRTAAERAAEARALAEQVPAEEASLAGALRARADAMETIEAQARVSLDEARRLGRVGDWNGAVAALEAIVRQPGWQLTAVRKEAEVELDGARTKAVRRVQLKQDLRSALTRGDLAACEAIAREIGLAYLPLVIASQPDGCEVVAADGTVKGVTPLILEISADERVDLRLTLRRPGYLPVEVSGAAAEGGWRLAVRLERAPVMAHQLGHPLTARPTALGSGLWLADRGRAVTLARPDAGALRSLVLHEVAPLAEPVFAPVSEIAGEVLLPTREGLALRLGDPVGRLPLPVATDRRLLGHRSPIVLDRDLLIVLGNDGRLHAVRRGTTALVWQSAAGAPFAADAVQLGESALVARADGSLERVRLEDGQNEGQAAVGAPVLVAWAAPDALGGLTATKAWRWDGAALTVEDLPEAVVGGGLGICVGQYGKVWLRGEKAWTEVGRLDPRPAASQTIQAVTWNGQAVVAYGPHMRVVGTQPFRLDAGSQLLAPLVWGEHLVAVSLDGGLWMWKP